MAKGQQRCMKPIDGALGHPRLYVSAAHAAPAPSISALAPAAANRTLNQAACEHAYRHDHICVTSELPGSGDMFMHRVAPVLALLFAFFAQTAHAQLGPPYLTPAHPTPSDTIYVNVFGGPCDILDGGPCLPSSPSKAAQSLLFFWRTQHRPGVLHL